MNKTIKITEEDLNNIFKRILLEKRTLTDRQYYRVPNLNYGFKIHNGQIYAVDFPPRPDRGSTKDQIIRPVKNFNGILQGFMVNPINKYIIDEDFRRNCEYFHNNWSKIRGSENFGQSANADYKFIGIETRQGERDYGEPKIFVGTIIEERIDLIEANWNKIPFKGDKNLLTLFSYIPLRKRKGYGLHILTSNSGPLQIASV